MSTTNNRIGSNPIILRAQTIPIKIPIDLMITWQDRVTKTSTPMKLIHPNSNRYNIPQSGTNPHHSSNINTLLLDINPHLLIQFTPNINNSTPQSIPSLIKDNVSNMTTDKEILIHSLMTTVLSATK